MNKSVEELYEDDALKAVATKIFEKLNSAKNKPELSAKRSVWELMQNAKDVKNIFGRVSIEIEIPDEHTFIFRHNGDHFTKKEVSSLINQVSSKDSTNSDPDQTGKYGTGFICTHLLSNVIDVDGVVLADEDNNDYRTFHLCLDRTGNSAEDLIPSIKEERRKFRLIDQDYKGDNFPFTSDYSKRSKNVFGTVFTYKLDSNEKLELAETSVNDLVNTLPLTLINVPKIESVHVINRLRNLDVTYNCQQTCIDEHVTRSVIETSGIPKVFLTYKTDDVALSIEIEYREDGQYAALPRSKEQPVLFRDFPLIGSNNFHFPFFLNGFRFNPTEQRNDLFLHGKEDHKASVDNRIIFEKAVDASLLFNEWLISHNLQHSYLLAASRIPQTTEPWNELTSKPWIESLQLKWRNQLLQQNLVEISGEQKRCLLSELKVPCCSKQNVETFYDLLVPFIKEGNLPLKNNISEWSNVLVEPKTWSVNLKYEIKDFINDLKGLADFSNLSARLNMDTVQAMDWLNKVITLIFEEEGIKTFQENALIPNELGDFKCIGEKFYTDHSEQIPEPIKDVYKIATDKDLHSILVNRDINNQEILDSIKPFNLSSLIAELNGFIKNISNNWSNRMDASYALMCLWSSEESKSHRVAMFNVIKRYTKAVNSFVNIPNVSDDLWTEADKLLLNATAIFIANDGKSVSDVIHTLFNNSENVSEDDYMLWFNDYLSLCKSKQITESLENNAIWPDQNCSLHKLQDLYYDNDIAEAFKDLAETAGTSIRWRSKLLNKNISGLETHQPKSNTDIYNDVKEAFDHNPDKQFKITKYAVSLIPLSLKDQESYEKKIYDAMKTIYPDMPEIRFVDNYEGFKKTLFRNSAIFFISKTIAETTNLTNFIKLLSSHSGNNVSEKEAILWLDNFIKFVKSLDNEKAWSHLTKTNGHGIWLNQHNDFCMYSEVNRDKDILNDLKDLTECNKIVFHDYRAELLNEKSTLSHLLPEKSMIGTQDILNVIDDRIKDFDKEGNKQSKEFSSLVFTLQKIYKTHHLDNVMTFYESNRNRLIVGSLEEGETMDIIGKMVSEPQKLKLAQELMDKVSNEDSLTNLINIAAHGVTPERLQELLEIESIYKTFQASFVDNRTEEQKQQDIETGRKGEEFVFHKLNKMKNIKSVTWANEQAEAYGPFDLIATTIDDKKIYIEVKSTSTSVTEADQISIPISTREWNYATEIGKESIYYLARVFNTLSDDAQVYFLESKPFDFDC